MSELLRRRPNQEPAKGVGDKVKSIGNQCGRAGLDGAHFEHLAAQADLLRREFSEAKQAKLPRERLKELVNRGLLFLDAFMTSIDETRLKRIAP